MNVGNAENEGGGGDGLPPPDFRGVRTKTHTYAVARDGRWILFDNVKYPYQMHNLIDDPAQKQRIDNFDSLIAEWLKEANDTFEYSAAIAQRSAIPAV